MSSSPRVLSNQFRSFLALGLAALIFLSPLSATALAQTQSDNVAVQKPGDAAPGKAFIIYENGGGIGCRDATLSERSEFFKPASGQKLRQINHLGDGDNYTVGEEGNGPGLKIILMATQQLEGNQVAKQAFVNAAARWEAIIQTPMTVYINVDYGPLNFGKPWSSPLVLGSTGSPSIFSGYSGVRTNLLAEATNSSNGAKTALFNLLPASFIPTELGDNHVMTVNASIARAIGLIPANADPNDPRPQIGFNSAKNFDFDPNPQGPGGPGCNNSGIDCNKTDFDAVATHEIGHALGFTSNNGESGEPPNAEVWDLFRFRPGVTNFNTNARVMAAGGVQIFYDGGSELGLSTGGPDGEATGGDGEQSSHWREDGSFPANNIGIMDPTIASGVRQLITNNDKRALNAFGYNLDNNTAPPPAPPAPGNDNFASATVLSGCSGTGYGTNLGATREAGEPNHAPDNGGGQRSVWYRWTAPSTGSVTFTTKGSSYDTVLGIYSGAAVGSLTPIEKNDDVTPGVITSSSITFNAVAGTTYMIAVDGYNNGGSGGDMGNVKLNWTQSDCTVTVTNDIKLSQNNYIFDESTINTAQGYGVLRVDVTRGDPNAGSATVQYFTEDAAGGSDCNVVAGHASQRCDYATAAGTLRFSPGEATKTILIPVVPDGYIEGNETFTLKLQNPTGATMGATSQATLTIQDRGVATTPAQNPYIDNSFFVRQLYLDILGREPDTDGFNTWTGVLNTCGPEKGFLGAPRACDRAFVSHGFVASPEFTDRGYYLHRMYEVGARRLARYSEFVPEMAGLSGAPGSAELEQNAAQYAENFVTKAEFVANYGSVSTTGQASQYIALLEQNAGVSLPATTTTLPGQPTQYNRQDLINKRASGEFSLGKTLRAFVEQKVVYDRFFERGFVTIQYFGFLKRDPDLNDAALAGWTEWVFVFTNGGAQRGRPDIGPRDIQHLIFGFIYSEEYRKRFGQP